MKLKQVFSRLAISSAVLLSGASQAALIIDNSAAINNVVFPFGSPNTATYGEAFHTNATDTVLDAFSMFLAPNNSTAPLDFRAYIGAWDGTRITGVLYASATETVGVAGGGFSFMPALQLAPNANYIAFLSISELPTQPFTTYGMPIAYGSGDLDPYTDGFYYQNSFNFPSRWSSTPWDSFGPGVADVRLLATLSPPGNAIPEPATPGLLGLALACLALASSRRSVRQYRRQPR